MGQLLRTTKGEISITNFEGRIRLRWSFERERYSLNLPHPYCPANMHHATVKVAEIKLDMMKGSFDSTLAKHKPLKEVKQKPILPSSPVVPVSAVSIIIYDEDLTNPNMAYVIISSGPKESIYLLKS